jgi:hypothetical protein
VQTATHIGEWERNQRIREVVVKMCANDSLFITINAYMHRVLSMVQSQTPVFVRTPSDMNANRVLYMLFVNKRAPISAIDDDGMVTGDTLLVGAGDTLENHVHVAVEFVSFIVGECNQILTWTRLKMMWETMVEQPCMFVRNVSGVAACFHPCTGIFHLAQ